MSEVIEGVVAAVESKTGKSEKGPWTRYGIKLHDGRFISTFDKAAGTSVETGRTYTFQVEYKGDYINLVKDTVPQEVAQPKEHPARGTTPGPTGETGRQQSIQRQVALKVAVDLVGYIMAHSNNKYASTEKVLSIASRFDAWLNGAEATDDPDDWADRGGMADATAPGSTPADPGYHPEPPKATGPQKRGSVDSVDTETAQDIADLRVLVKEALAERWPNDRERRNEAAFCHGFGKVATVEEIPPHMLREALEMAPGPKGR